MQVKEIVKLLNARDIYVNGTNKNMIKILQLI